jgi:iduronate 2-sulfatase
MKRILFPILLGLSMTPLVLKAADQPLNILLIMTDDLNCDIGCYGNPIVKTPNLDRLATQSVRFSANFCQHALCGPSRNSMLSGMYPDQIECYNLKDTFRHRFPDAVPLPQYFMKNGYLSARIGKIYHYDNPGQIGSNGVDDPASWNERYNPIGRDKDLEKAQKIETLTGKGRLGAQLSWYSDPTGKPEEHTDGKVAIQAIELLQKYSKGNKPFFLGVGFYKPHTPYVAPKKYFDLYDEATLPVIHTPDSYANTIPPAALKTLKTHMEEWNITDEEARKAIHGYYAVISFVDDQIGRVLAELDRLGLRDKTIILFTSDNGYHLGEHRHWQKQTLFQNAAQVPLMISYPGMKNPGKTTSALCELVDCYPTLCELAGLPIPKAISGISQVPVLNNPETTLRTSALTYHGTVRGKEGYSIVTDRYRFTRWNEGAPNNIELYDRQQDPAEMNNLAQHPEQYPELIKTLNKELQKRIDQGKAIPEGLTPSAHSGNKPKSKKEQQKLDEENNSPEG